MRRFLRVAAVTATVGLFLVPAAGAASAAAAATHPKAPHFHVPVRGGIHQHHHEAGRCRGRAGRRGGAVHHGAGQ